MASYLEIAAFNAPSAVHALKAGAHRIELCANYPLGGVTPSLSTLHEIRAHTSASQPINIMIRPRGGNFTYTAAEFAQMKSEIATFRADGSASGFVFGILDEDGLGVDEVRNRELVELAAPLPCTFHRAFDGVRDKTTAAEMLVRCGFKAILTSGGLSGAVEGADEVAMLREVMGERIVFVLGGGVRAGNVQALRRRSGVEWFHSAAITAAGEDVDVAEVERLLGVLGREV